MNREKVATAGRGVWLPALVGMLVVATLPAQPTYEVVHRFRASGQTVADEIASQSRLILAPDGDFYGTTYWGGAAGFGTIFRMTGQGVVTTLHSFAFADGAMPAAGLLRSSDGSLYGTTALGGAHNLGTVFRNDASGVLTRLHSFDGADGQYPLAGVIQASDGNFYGVTNSGGAHGAGTVFRIDAQGDFRTLHSFDRDVDGSSPVAELLEVDAHLYGSTKFGGPGGFGTVFRIDPAGDDFSTIHVFAGADGRNPCAPLIRAASGDLYGLTSRGGTNDAGTVFRIDSSSLLTTIHHFDQYEDGAIPRSPLLQTLSGDFFGTASGGSGDYVNGTVFRITDSGTLEVLHTFEGTDGVHPIVSLVQAADGGLYGLTSAFFSLPDLLDVPGTAFRMDPGGTFVTLYRFGWEDGIGLLTPLLQAADGFIYGSTSEGGTNNQGTLFRMSSTGEVVKLLDYEGGTNGAGPAHLMQASDGEIYGTDGGGANGYGRIFRLDPSGSTTTLHSFDGTDGIGPNGLVEASDGKLYGTAYSDSYGGYGTFFRIGTAGTFDALGAFHPDQNGSHPRGTLVEAYGKFIGTTEEGGRYGSGCVFSAGPESEIVAEYSFAFDGSDGAFPATGLVDVDGDCWGTTSGGGPEGNGSVFMFRYHDLLPKHFFNGADGSFPVASLTPSPMFGTLYGTTALGGPASRGTIYSIDYDGNATTLYAFPGQMDGGYPNTPLVHGSDGLFYGTAGVIYRLSNGPVAVNQIMPTSGPASGNPALVVIGGGFLDDAAVTVGDAPGTDVTVLDSTFLHLFAPSLSPGTLNDISVTVPGGLGPATATRPKAFFADFLDVPRIDSFHDFVERIFRKGITAGCGGGSYCPQNAVTRAQMAVLLLKSKHGSAYVPPPCAGIFGDVPCPSMFADWIEQLAAEGITAGCGGGNYCPSSPVTRAQMAVFLLKAEHGSAYVPPACGGVFSDVSCPSPFADWIEQLSVEQITGGCGGGNYCPDNANTRAQMAVFLVKAFKM